MNVASAIVCGIVLSILLSSCASLNDNTEETSSEPDVRVCLADGVQQIEVHTGGSAVLETVDKRYLLPDSSTLMCKLTAKGALEVRIGARSIVTVEGVFRCYHRVPERVFGLDGKIYSDTLLFATDGSKMYVVNILPLETYLTGVVPNEIGRNRKADELEAVKAQAILARTYALTKIDLPLTRLFDVYDDVRDQVYTGLVHRSALTTRAVRETAGMTLQYAGRYAECYFHSTCGGSTEAVSLVWKRPQSKPYLAGVSDADGDGSFCSASPLYRWTELYSRTDFEAMLRTFLPAAIDTLDASRLPDHGWNLLDIRVLDRMPSRRIARLQIVMGDRVKKWSYILEADKIRWAIRRSDASSILRSVLFDVLLERDVNRWITQVRIDGGGNGHGIGMCQWGAIGRAKKGQDIQKILTAYFPGTEIVKIY